MTPLPDVVQGRSTVPYDVTYVTDDTCNTLPSLEGAYYLTSWAVRYVE